MLIIQMRTRLWKGVQHASDVILQIFCLGVGQSTCHDDALTLFLVSFVLFELWEATFGNVTCTGHCDYVIMNINEYILKGFISLILLPICPTWIISIHILVIEYWMTREMVIYT